ncbi:hybrid sensor histidine kinase/response regulator [Cytophagaceae bacterium ABcell3]|nr:hybrid sensor histidine kinase/response regulator [Cytophagaceae bacterium ABcell3]
MTMPYKDKVNILLVDDDEEDFIITRDIVGEIPNRNYLMKWEPSYDKALESIINREHDVYLIDYRLGARTGLELIKEATSKRAYAPLILLTGQGDVEVDVQAMRAGAADYLIKGNLNPHYLERAIRYSLQHAYNLGQIRKLNFELEARVEERTKELEKTVRKLEFSNNSLKVAQIELSKALEKEKELNELKSRFVTIASHEFRTPLSTILSSVSLVSKYTDPADEDKRLKHINRIKSSVNNLKGILDDFLSISRLEEGNIYNNPVETDLKDFMEEVAEEMRSVAKSGQEIICHFSGETRLINLDRQILKNIIINLLSNAIKYSPAGKAVDFTISTTKKEISLTVKDQGIGIPEKDQPHLFSRFFRANNCGNVQGTGLGLNIVKKYIDILNGSIEYTSQENVGTTFFVRIPLK